MSDTGYRAAGAPPGLRLYAVGDIHGRFDLLRQTCDRIDADLRAQPPRAALEVYLGDYIDRGPSSAHVLDFLGRRQRMRGNLVCLMGNHEFYLLQSLRDPQAIRAWLQVGGGDTLLSYGVQPPLKFDARTLATTVTELRARLPQADLDFLASLPTTFVAGDYVFVHAGLRPGVPLGEQKPEDLMTIREPFLSCTDLFGRVVVHGHSPVREVDVRPNRINIDTGAFASGTLSCLVIEADRLRLL
jgi:serine/threonine protein phosphatase 1